jgi:hypothetical protein
MRRMIRVMVMAAVLLAALPAGALAAGGAGAAVYLVAPGFHVLLTQASGGASEAGDQFGAALGAADFDGNNADNLVIGAPGEDVGTAADAGAVNSFCGFDGFLTSCSPALLFQGTRRPATASARP